MNAPKTLPFSKTPVAEDWKLKRAVGNWNSLNSFLKTGATASQLQQMINLESIRPGGPRLPMVERMFAKWVKVQRTRIYRAMGLNGPN